MGNSHVKEKGFANEKVVEGLKNKVKLLQGEINEIMCIRESENQAYEQEMMVFEIKEVEWRRERRKLRGEVKKLRKKLNFLEERFEGKINENVGDENENELKLLGSSLLLQHFMEEKARRDEALEKWKQLYFAVKVELDDLIQRTNNQGYAGEALYMKAEEESKMEELQKQLKFKEEGIEILEAKVASMEQQVYRREREVDILKQSLRIMSHKIKPTKVSKSNHSYKKQNK